MPGFTHPADWRALHINPARDQAAVRHAQGAGRPRI